MKRSLRSLPNDLRQFAKYHLKRRVYDYPAPETELGIVLLDYDADAYRDKLMSYRDRFAIDTLEEVRYRDRSYPIHRITTGHDGAGRRLLVLAGVHGNERAGLLAVPHLLDHLDAHRERFRGVEIVIVTPVNPVGAAAGSRYNADGFDINRDFSRFDTPEARAVRHAFAEARPHFMVALHEGPHEGTFLFANRLVARDRAEGVLAALAAEGVALAPEDYFGRSLEPPGYAPMTRTMWALSVLWERTLGMMATGMWAERQRVPEITLESSWRHAEAHGRVTAHVVLVRAIAEMLADEMRAVRDGLC
ncbi:MAG TPA: DUF2817 domain-containing protein [Polyangiaceae bacterium]|jgi:hypothetical protein|nr:DUF2817 domain-containing protein [Polyangiaceae bacterium]